MTLCSKIVFSRRIAQNSITRIISGTETDLPLASNRKQAKGGRRANAMQWRIAEL